MNSQKVPIISAVILSLSLAGYTGYSIVLQQNRILGTKTTAINRASVKPISKTAAKKIILSARTTKEVDPRTGIGKRTVTVFSTKSPVIYVSLAVARPPLGTKFEYVRYFNGKYIDHGSLETSKNAMKNISFSWKLKDINSRHLAGNYRVKLYVNGNFEKEVAFTVK